MQLILTLPHKVRVILKEISFNCGSPKEQTTQNPEDIVNSFAKRNMVASQKHGEIVRK